ncbi:thiazolinyl imide reductase subfamily [Salmonella enterica subsp. enterica serovar Hvittingfoss]|nr:thiazolinyl imide reductase subfamily [Salmonella enterica subsp. enterica serovar Hvittingfoss]
MICQPVRVLICGSTFAQFYITALLAQPTRYQLVGILARGSDRSKQLAKRHQLPLFRAVADIPSDIDLACVVLRAGVLGGNGTTLTKQLLALGISVLQEQPLHQQEVAECLRCARQHGVRFHVVDHYLQLDNVRRFVSAARSILNEQPGQWIDAACANQVLFPLLHMLGEISPPSAAWRVSCISKDPAQPLQILQGYLGNVPLTLRVWNQVDPDDPDNHLPLLQQLTLGVAGGTLMLQDTHGELGWLPRLYIPKEVRQAFDFGAPAAVSLIEDSVLNLSAPTISIRDQLMQHWPAAIAREVGHFLMLADDETVSRQRSQQLLLSCQRWQQATTALGYPMIKSGQHYHYLPLTVLKTAVESVNIEPTLTVTPQSLPAELLVAVEVARPITQAITLSQTQQFVRQLDHAVLLSMLRALQSAGGLDGTGRSLDTPALLAGLGVASRHQELIARWVEILYQRRYLSVEGGRWRCLTRVQEADWQECWRLASESWLGLGAESFIHYLRSNAERLLPLMRDEQQAISSLLPKGSMAITDTIYCENIIFRYMNTLIASLVCQRAHNQQGLRVLEVGAGNGVTTDVVLAQCHAEDVQVNYHFSDFSTFFIEKARERYRHHAMQFSLVDINCSFAEQGIPAASHDVVICSGVLNSVKETLRVLRELRGLLVPGGWLLFSGATREHYEFLTSQAFIMPEPRDDRQRTRERFFSIVQWRDALWRAGFGSVWVLPEEDHPLTPLGQRLFVAAIPDSSHSPQD